MNRYDIFEDFGPYFATALTPPTFALFYAWPVAIGCVSFFFCSECPGLSSAFGTLSHWSQLILFARSTSAIASSRR